MAATRRGDDSLVVGVDMVVDLLTNWTWIALAGGPGGRLVVSLRTLLTRPIDQGLTRGAVGRGNTRGCVGGLEAERVGG